MLKIKATVIVFVLTYLRLRFCRYLLGSVLLRINYGFIIGPRKENRDFLPARLCMANKFRRNPEFKIAN